MTYRENSTEQWLHEEGYSDEFITWFREEGYHDYGGDQYIHLPTRHLFSLEQIEAKYKRQLQTQNA